MVYSLGRVKSLSLMRYELSHISEEEQFLVKIKNHYNL